MPAVTATVADRHPMERRHLEIGGRLYSPQTVQREWCCARCGELIRYTVDGYRCACGEVSAGARVCKLNALRQRRARETYEYDVITQGGRAMPIKGLTNRQPRFPEIGHIRKGAIKNPKENRPGQDLTYFRVEFEAQEAHAADVFRRAYGEQPQELNIMLAFDDLEQVWDAWREHYTAGGLTHRCDGEIVQYPPEERGAPCRLQNLPDKEARCKPVGRLRVIIPELQRLAYLTVHTTSIHDIINITSQLDALYQLAGRLTGIPLVLRRRPRKISTPSGPDGKRARREKWLLSIEADPEWVAAKLTALKLDALPGNGLPALPERAGAEPAPTGIVWADFEDDDEEYEAVEGEAIEDTTKQTAVEYSGDARWWKTNRQSVINTAVRATKSAPEHIINRLIAGVRDERIEPDLEDKLLIAYATDPDSYSPPPEDAPDAPAPEGEATQPELDNWFGEKALTTNYEEGA